MVEIEKINILLDHWIKHNESHIKSYREWVEQLRGGNLNEISLKIEEAAQIISRANEKIKESKEMLK